MNYIKEKWRIRSWYDGCPLTVEYEDGTWQECGDQEDEDEYVRLCQESEDECIAAGMKPNAEGIYTWGKGPSPIKWRTADSMPKWAARTEKVKNV